MTDITFADMAVAAESDLLGKRQRLEICRARSAKGQWPTTDIKLKEDALPVFEKIANTLRALADCPPAIDAARKALKERV